MGGNSINGTPEEKAKYYLLSDTFDIIYDCMHWAKVESSLSGLLCIKLALTNIGTTYDEDVEISLTIPNEYYIELSDLFQFDNSVMGYLLNDCEISTLFGIKAQQSIRILNHQAKLILPLFILQICRLLIRNQIITTTFLQK